MGWTLKDIRSKTRQVTGRFSSSQLTDANLDTKINNYYVYTLPNELKLEREYTYYEFFTTPDIREYTFPVNYVNVEPVFYIDGTPLDYYQDADVFYASHPESITRYLVATGDGATSAYTFSVTPSIVPGSGVITDNTLTCYDDGVGGWTGDSLAGTIAYTTGAITITFTANIANGNEIWFSYEAYTAGTPSAVLLYDNVFRLSPTPDTVYRCKIKAFAMETAMTATTDTPRLQEWGPLIAYGAAMDIFSDFGEQDRRAEVNLLYKEELLRVLRRTSNKLMNERAFPRF